MSDQSNRTDYRPTVTSTVPCPITGNPQCGDPFCQHEDGRCYLRDEVGKPESTDVGPGYWMNESSGVLRPAVTAYLMREPMTDSQIAAMRAYLRQWMAGNWLGGGIENLRVRIDALTNRSAISAWLSDALLEGIDPL